MKFELKENQPFIELNKLLQIMKIAQTGGHSKILIKNNDVMVNEQIETQIRKKLKQGDIVKIGTTEITIV
jgi:ribosome-associated protein